MVDAPKLALRDFELAVELDSKNGDAYNGRGFARAAWAAIARLSEDAAEAIRLGPPSPRLLYNAARIYAQCPGSGPQRALDLIQKALGMLPEEERARLLVDAYSVGRGHGRAAALFFICQDWTPSCPTESNSCVHGTRALSMRGQHAAPVVSWLPDGDWLEDRTLLATSPLDQAVPLHFGAFNDAQVSHFLSIPDEFDLYSVALQQGEMLDASIERPAVRQRAWQSLLRVFDASGTPLALDDQQGGDPQLSFQAAAAGIYYVGVSSAPNDNYNPTSRDSGVPGATTGLYTLDVNLTNGGAAAAGLDW